MASAVTFQPPSGLHGSNEQQLKQMYSYLYQMSEKLNVAMEQVDGHIGEVVATAMVNGAPARGNGSKPGVSPSISDQYKTLRDLIISTGNIIRGEMEAIETTLKSEYLTQSEFGTFEESLETTIKATAKEVVLSYDYGSRLEAAETALAGFEEYDVSTLQYIKMGLIKEDEQGVPVVGILIAKEFSSVTVDGVEYPVGVNTYSAFTSDRISFYYGETEMAYLSNNTLYVTHIRLPVGGKLTQGNWRTDTDHGFSIKWIGGGE